MARLGKISGKHFRIMWDNAYAVHYLTEQPVKLHNLFSACLAQGTEDTVIITGSTSKVTFAGAGIAFLGTSTRNLQAFQKHLSAATIGPDKLNQLRHANFLRNEQGIREHMARHKAILKPKFDKVQELLDSHLQGKGMGSWTKPEGGYFVSFDTLPGLAREVVKLADQAGVKLTPAGATFPYGKDVNDTNIRIAPTYPNMADLEKALQVFVICVQLASVNQILATP
jgi:DNA-binding transcriptional MocR family regulator